ncbi:MAG: TfoX/Sxy family protein [Saprospiraceae bacterium]
MAYDEVHASRIRQAFAELKVGYTEKKMFSGICFMVDDKMCCGSHIDKATGESLLLCRIGESASEKALELPEVLPMNFTGKPMKGYIFVTEDGLQSQKDLAKWIGLCVEYNPLAKKSAKKK